MFVIYITFAPYAHFFVLAIVLVSMDGLVEFSPHPRSSYTQSAVIASMTQQVITRGATIVTIRRTSNALETDGSYGERHHWSFLRYAVKSNGAEPSLRSTLGFVVHERCHDAYIRFLNSLPSNLIITVDHAKYSAFDASKTHNLDYMSCLRFYLYHSASVADQTADRIHRNSSVADHHRDIYLIRQIFSSFISYRHESDYQRMRRQLRAIRAWNERKDVEMHSRDNWLDMIDLAMGRALIGRSRSGIHSFTAEQKIIPGVCGANEMD